MPTPDAVPGSSLSGWSNTGGRRIGEYETIYEAVRRVVHEVAVVKPALEIASAYAQQLKQYQWLRSLKPPPAN